ncbi:MAG TPA: hypothetical protein VFH45_08895 [Acidimicrobiales bacterium]|nr:hypothetical protein [Acidimicrobiales bacterium]
MTDAIGRSRDAHEIEVRNRFEGGWSRGYLLDEVISNGDTEVYRVRRRSDGRVLPLLFQPGEIRPLDNKDFVVDWEMTGAG